MNGFGAYSGAKGSQPSAFEPGRPPTIRTLIVKKTHPRALPAMPPAGGGSVFRRMGPPGAQAHGGPGLGPAHPAAAHAGDVSAAPRDRTVSGVLRCPRRLPQRPVSKTQAPARALRGLPALAPLLPAEAALRDPGQLAQHPRSSPLPRPPAAAADPPRTDPDRGLVAQPDRGPVRRPEAIHLGEHRRPHAHGTAPARLSLSPLPTSQTRVTRAPVESNSFN